jgi:hypothetical protein
MNNRPTLDDLRKQDPNFDFDNAYKHERLMFTLVVGPTTISLRYKLDGEMKELTDSEAKFTVMEKVFRSGYQNPSLVPVENPRGMAQLTWTTREAAEAGLQQMVQDEGYVKLDEAGIIEHYWEFYAR